MDILELKIGDTSKKLKLLEVKQDVVTFKNDEKSVKAIFILENDGQSINVSEIFIKDYKGALKEQGTWIRLDSSGQLASGSGLAKLLRFYQVSNLKDLIGKELFVTKNVAGYYSLTTYEPTLEENTNSSANIKQLKKDDLFDEET